MAEAAARPQQSPGFDQKKIGRPLFVIVRERLFGIIWFD
jgi:hypothetical protein